ncbi:MAG TPA: TetR family transcriptional regulator [Acidimicrobiales bacterium]|nr:TetR family transcriptional regulator [Acidimicrobiales bacterium]
MRSAVPTSDLRAAAVIRERAMELFAQSGVAKVTVRQIASAAGVSPALVIHHFGSKDGLKNAIDERVVAVFDALIADLQRLEEEGSTATLAALFARQLDQQPALTDYIARLLVEDGPAGDALFQRLYETTVAGVRRLVETGAVRVSADEPVRAMFLLVNDLAALLLRHRIRQAIGIDPLLKGGITRWTAAVLETYATGLFVAAKGTSEPSQEQRQRKGVE